MISISAIFTMIFVWFIRRAVRRAIRGSQGFKAKVEMSRLHMLDPSEQMKVFLTDRDLVSPTRAFEEAYGAEEAELEPKATAAIDQAIARAQQKKPAPAPAPPVATEARSFGRRRVG